MIFYDEDINPYKTGKRWDQLIDLKSYAYGTVRNLNVGNGTYFKIIFFRSKKGANTRFFLGIERIGCFIFTENGHFYHPNYLVEKLNLCIADANNIADWVNIQLGIEAQEYGRYNDEFCVDRTQES